MLNTKNLVWSSYAILGILLMLFLHTYSPNLEYDAMSYVNFGPQRPFLYPLFIWLFQWAHAYQFKVIIWVQGILLFGTLLYSRVWLKKHLNINEFVIWLIFFITLITIAFHYQVWYIQPEGLTFPLFIPTFFLLVECFYQFNLKKIVYLAIFVSGLIWLRLQFYFFYPLFGMLMVWAIYQKTPLKQILAAFFILFLSIGITILADHAYHYYKHGFFSGDFYSETLILVQPIYLLEDAGIVKSIADPQLRNTVQTLIDERNKQHLNKDAALLDSLRPSYLEFAYQSYLRNYTALSILIENTLKANLSYGKKTLYNENQIAKEINKILIPHELKKNFIFLIWKFVECMGGIPLFLFFLILLFAPYRVFKERIRHPDISVIFIVMTASITFLNAGIIALCNPYLPVYFCYSQFMFYCLGGYLTNSIFMKALDSPPPISPQSY